MKALAVLLPTVALAYLAAWRVAGEWPLRHRLGWGPWLALWGGVALSAVGFGVAVLWLEILAIHLGHAPQWGLKFYAPAIETVAVIDVLSLAFTTINHVVFRHLKGQSAFSWRPDGGDGLDLAGDAIEALVPRGGGSVSRVAAADTGAGLSDAGGAASSGDWWPGFGLDLDLGEEGAILAVGVFVFLVAALLVAVSLLGGAFVTYAVLRIHADT